MMTWFDLFPQFRAPTAESFVQAIAPVTSWFSPNIEVNYKGVPAIEREIVTSVAGYGSQLGTPIDALLELGGGDWRARVDRRCRSSMSSRNISRPSRPSTATTTQVERASRSQRWLARSAKADGPHHRVRSHEPRPTRMRHSAGESRRSRRRWSPSIDDGREAPVSSTVLVSKYHRDGLTIMLHGWRVDATGVSIVALGFARRCRARLSGAG